MRILAIFGHPDLDNSKVSRAWHNIFAANGGITINRLDKIHNNFQFDIPAQRKLIAEHDRIVIIFPIHWYGTPALLKKWLDDIISADADMSGKELIIAVSSGSPVEAYRVGGRNSWPLDILCSPWHAMAIRFGMKFYPIYAVHNATGKEQHDFEQSGQTLLKQLLSENPAVMNQI